MNEEQIKRHFAQRLAELRKNKGMTQLQLAESLNYSDKAVSKWERGESIPDAYTLLKIAKLFSVPLDYLLDRDFKYDQVSADSEPNASKDRALHIFIPFISVLGTYFVGSILFFIMKNITFLNAFAPLSFMLATVAAFIVLTVFSAIWWKAMHQCVCISGLIWSAGGFLAMLLSFLDSKYIFIPCALLQCICILIYVFIYFLKRSKKATAESDKKKDEEISV